MLGVVIGFDEYWTSNIDLYRLRAIFRNNAFDKITKYLLDLQIRLELSSMICIQYYLFSNLVVEYGYSH